MKQCTICAQVKSSADFNWRKRWCRECERIKNAHQRAKRRANGKTRAYDMRRARRQYERLLTNKYGLTLDQYAEMLASQNFRCAICGQQETSTIGKTGTTRTLAVDHDHITGRVRGLLCTACNQALGYFRDDPALIARALAYLGIHSTVNSSGASS